MRSWGRGRRRSVWRYVRSLERVETKPLSSRSWTPCPAAQLHSATRSWRSRASVRFFVASIASTDCLGSAGWPASTRRLICATPTALPDEASEGGVGSCSGRCGGYSRSSAANSSALSRVARRVASKTISSRAVMRGSSTTRPALTSITAVGDSAAQTKPARRSARRQSAHKTSPRRTTEACSARTVPFDVHDVSGEILREWDTSGHPAKAKCKTMCARLRCYLRRLTITTRSARAPLTPLRNVQPHGLQRWQHARIPPPADLVRAQAFIAIHAALVSDLLVREKRDVPDDRASADWTWHV